MMFNSKTVPAASSISAADVLNATGAVAGVALVAAGAYAAYECGRKMSAEADILTMEAQSIAQAKGLHYSGGFKTLSEHKAMTDSWNPLVYFGLQNPSTTTATPAPAVSAGPSLTESQFNALLAKMDEAIQIEKSKATT